MIQLRQKTISQPSISMVYIQPMIKVFLYLFLLSTP